MKGREEGVATTHLIYRETRRSSGDVQIGRVSMILKPKVKGIMTAGETNKDDPYYRKNEPSELYHLKRMQYGIIENYGKLP